MWILVEFSQFSRLYLYVFLKVSSIRLKKSGIMNETFQTKSESQVLILYVGGTIGMVKSSEGVYSPSPRTLINLLKIDPKMHDSSYLVHDQRPVRDDSTTLVLPEINNSRRIIYTIQEYESLIDSCDVSWYHWKKIATDVYENYAKYDGFVILHGTDTLCYTASALSFILENLGKSVVLTGSQIPMCEPRSDGNDNFIGALIFAGNFTIPEVTIYFHNKLMRGNRTIKFNASNLDPFASPNAAEIATMGTEIVVNYSEILCPTNFEKFSIHTNLNENVGVLRIFPNIPLNLVHSFLHSGLEGFVLQTFGCGNITSTRKDILFELESAVKRGVFIINCTQCYSGNVSDTYETGQVLTNIGVISGRDMTTEAALSKLSYVLGKDEWDHSIKTQMLTTNLRGEMQTNVHNVVKEKQFHKMMKLKQIFGLVTQEEVKELSNTIMPALIIKAVRDQDIQQLNVLKGLGANFNIPNEDQRTPLHVACCAGNTDIVEFLLVNGCMIHVKDRNNKTPLIDAILHDHHNVIHLLRKCGAHIPNNVDNIGENLCGVSAVGLCDRLNSYYLAGVDLNHPDYSGRTPLHAAVISGNLKTVQFLVNKKVRMEADKFGDTALDYAFKLSQKDIRIREVLFEYNEKLKWEVEH